MIINKFDASWLFCMNTIKSVRHAFDILNLFTTHGAEIGVTEAATILSEELGYKVFRPEGT